MKACHMKPTGENNEANLSYSANIILNVSVSKVSFYPAFAVLVRNPQTLKRIRQHTSTATSSLSNHIYSNS
jgi:hypothetical protein